MFNPPQSQVFIAKLRQHWCCSCRHPGSTSVPPAWSGCCSCRAVSLLCLWWLLFVYTQLELSLCSKLFRHPVCSSSQPQPVVFSATPLSVSLWKHGSKSQCATVNVNIKSLIVKLICFIRTACAWFDQIWLNVLTTWANSLIMHWFKYCWSPIGAWTKWEKQQQTPKTHNLSCKITKLF